MSSVETATDYHERVAQVRAHLELSQEKMAQRIKCSLRAYANYERGERVIPVELVRALYEQCSIDPIWLLTGEGTMIVDRDVRYRLDQRVLDSAVAAAERIEQHLGQPLKTRRKARLIGLLYEQSQLISQTENDLPDDSRLHRLLK